MMKIVFTLLLSISITLAFSQNSAHSKSKIHEVVVKEFMQTTSYTYLYVTDKDSAVWLAVPKMDPIVNNTYYYTGGMEMRNFRSAELDTVFYTIFFISGIYDKELFEEKESPETLKDTVIKPIEGGITISELLSNKSKYAGKKVKLTGRVSKFNSNIIRLNWIHLDDGSGPSGTVDLTITTDELTEVGDIIVIEGTITLNKDFGGGYFYEIIMENGRIVK